jgi:hypothetical protein
MMASWGHTSKKRKKRYFQRQHNYTRINNAHRN